MYTEGQKRFSLFRYLRESKEELQKVTWPSRKDTTRYSIFIIVISLAIAFFFGTFDWALNLGLQALIALSS